MVPIEIIEQKYQSFDRLHLTTECSNQRRYPELCFYELVFDASCATCNKENTSELYDGVLCGKDRKQFLTKVVSSKQK